MKSCQDGWETQPAIDGQCGEALIQFTGEERAGIRQFEKRMNGMLKGRRLFSTAGGLLGIGPWSILSEKECRYEVHVIKGKGTVRPGKAHRWEVSFDRRGICSRDHEWRELPGKMSDKQWCKYDKIRLI